MRDIDPVVVDAMLRFRILLDETYGESLRELHLCGSRARGVAGRHSDVDLAIVLDKITDRPHDERMRLADLSYDVLLGTGIEIHPHVVTSPEWADGSAHGIPDLVRNMKRDAFPLTHLLKAAIVDRMRQPRIVGETSALEEAAAIQLDALSTKDP